MAFVIISTLDNNLLAGPVEDLPVPMPENSYPLIAPISFGTGMVWSSEAAGFVAAVAPSQRPVITVGRFKLLFTGEERISLRQAADTDPVVYDALDLLNGFTDGISLDDPILAALLAQMVAKGLLAEDRVATILAGEPQTS